MMYKFIVPICDILKSKIYNATISAASFNECKTKLMEKFEVYDTVQNYPQFVKDMDKRDILIGKITDVETL